MNIPDILRKQIIINKESLPTIAMIDSRINVYKSALAKDKNNKIRMNYLKKLEDLERKILDKNGKMILLEIDDNPSRTLGIFKDIARTMLEANKVALVDEQNKVYFFKEEYLKDIEHFYSILKEINTRYKILYELLFKFLKEYRILDEKEKQPRIPQLSLVFTQSSEDSKIRGVYFISKPARIAIYNSIFKVILSDKNKGYKTLQEVLIHELMHYIQDQTKDSKLKIDFKKEYAYIENPNKRYNTAFDLIEKEIRKMEENFKAENIDIDKKILNLIQFDIYHYFKDICKDLGLIYEVIYKEKSEKEFIKKIGNLTSEISRLCMDFSKTMRQMDKEVQKTKDLLVKHAKTKEEAEKISEHVKQNYNSKKIELLKKELNENFKQLSINEFYDKNERWRYEEVFSDLLKRIVYDIKYEIEETKSEGTAEYLSQYFCLKVLGYTPEDTIYEERVIRISQSFNQDNKFEFLHHVSKLNLQ